MPSPHKSQQSVRPSVNTHLPDEWSRGGKSSGYCPVCDEWSLGRCFPTWQSLLGESLLSFEQEPALVLKQSAAYIVCPTGHLRPRCSGWPLSCAWRCITQGFPVWFGVLIYFLPAGLTSLLRVHCLILYACGHISVKRKLGSAVHEHINAYQEDHDHIACSLCKQTSHHYRPKSTLYWCLNHPWPGHSMGYGNNRTVCLGRQNGYFREIPLTKVTKVHNNFPNVHSFAIWNMTLIEVPWRELKLLPLN